MKDYYLAIDLGASGGRHILGFVEDEKLFLYEVYRLNNAPISRDNCLLWDTDLISAEIIAGLKASSDWIKERQTSGSIPAGSIPAGKIPAGILRSVSIDTWGVDYVLLDEKGNIIKPVFAYRDSRTEAFLKTLMPFEDRYRITGTADLPFNTIYQILADKASGRL
jgi:rhamnulokinase